MLKNINIVLMGMLKGIPMSFFPVMVFFVLFLFCSVSSGDDLETIELRDISENSFVLYTGTIDNLFEDSSLASKSTIQDSCNNDSGLLNINQASGNMNNQSNSAIITFQQEGSIININSYHEGISTGNKIKITGASSRKALISGSFLNAKGVFMVNQSPGNLNQQSNVFVLSIGKPVELGERELSMISGDNIIDYDKDAGIERKDTLVNSFTNSSGIGMITQSSGDLNTIHNTLAISFSKEAIK